MNTVNNPSEILTVLTLNPTENTTNTQSIISDNTIKQYQRKKPKLEIIVKSPTDEEYKMEQMEKGYVSKVKPYVTKWIHKTVLK